MIGFSIKRHLCIEISSKLCGKGEKSLAYLACYAGKPLVFPYSLKIAGDPLEFRGP